MAQITIDDKVQYEENPLPDINKWTAADINHFKGVINTNDTDSQNHKTDPSAHAAAIAAAIDALIGGAPGALDTLNELAAALADDANFSTTVINLLALKLSITQARRVRSVTGADSIVQDDDNGLIIFNSATPFNFTLDQLTSNIAGNETTKVNFINIGAGAVTFINGSGVTLTGSAVLPGAVNTDYPSALITYITATAPKIISGTSKIDLNTTSTATGTITLDCNGQVERIFVGSASFSSAKTVALSNDTNALVINMVFTITNVAGTIDFPSTFTMPVTDARWNDSNHRFTPANTGKHEFNAVFDGTDWNMVATNPYA